jgi:hypothetical protein
MVLSKNYGNFERIKMIQHNQKISKESPTSLNHYSFLAISSSLLITLRLQNTL